MKRFTTAAAIVAMGVLAFNASAAQAGKYGSMMQKLHGGSSGSNYSNNSSGSNKNSHQQHSSGNSNQTNYKWTGNQPTFAKGEPHGDGHKHDDGHHHNDSHHDDHGHHHHHHDIPWWAVSRPPIVVSRPVVVRQPVIVQRPIVVSTPVATGLPQIAPGSQVVLSATDLGDTFGVVAIRIGEVTLPVEIISWTPEAVTVRVPAMTLTSTTPAQLAVVRADGSLARTVDVELTAGIAGKL